MLYELLGIGCRWCVSKAGSTQLDCSTPTPFAYKGQWGYYTDVETGILLLTHRYLDPATGRFLTRDPIGFEGGVNLYAYVGNGVVVGSDARGLSPVGSLVCRRIVIGIGTAVSDGPLPVGDIVACGIVIITICEIVGEIVKPQPPPKPPKARYICKCGIRQDVKLGCPPFVYGYGSTAKEACKNAIHQPVPPGCGGYYGHCKARRLPQ